MDDPYADLIPKASRSPAMDDPYADLVPRTTAAPPLPELGTTGSDGPSNQRGHTPALVANLLTRANDALHRGVPESAILPVLAQAAQHPSSPDGLGDDPFAGIPHQAPPHVISRDGVQAPQIYGHGQPYWDQIAAEQAAPDPINNTAVDRIIAWLDAGTKQSVGGGLQALGEQPTAPIVNALTQAVGPARANDILTSMGIQGGGPVGQYGAGLVREGVDAAAGASVGGHRTDTSSLKTFIADVLRDPKAAAIYHGGNVVQSVPMLLAAIATENPELGSTVAGTLSGAQQYGQDRLPGADQLDPNRALLDAGANAVLEKAGEELALDALFGKGSGSALRDFLKIAGTEGGQELATGAGQEASTEIVHGRPIDPERIKQAAIDSGIAGGLMGGGLGAPVAIAHSLAAPATVPANAPAPAAATPADPATDSAPAPDAAQGVGSVLANLAAGHDPAGQDKAKSAIESILAALGPKPNQVPAQSPLGDALKMRPAETAPPSAELLGGPDAAPESAPRADVAAPVARATPAGDGESVPPRPEVQLPEGVARPAPASADHAEHMTDSAVVELPVAALRLSPDVPQFKGGANSAGVVEPLGGTFDRRGTGPIQVWQRLDGRMEVISGRHRLDLARRSGDRTIPSQVYKESDGFDARQAASLDAELNIRDGQGKVADYVQFFQQPGFQGSAGRQTAESRGLLARATGKRAYAIAVQGDAELIAAHRAAQLTDEAAFQIAGAAPKDQVLQALGMRQIQQGRSIAHAVNTMRAVGSMRGPRADQVDMFGLNDSAIRDAEAMAEVAAGKQRDINERLAAITGAAKRPELARKEGIDVHNQQAVQARIEQLRTERDSWEHWHTDPDRVALVRREAGLTEQTHESSDVPNNDQNIEPVQDEHSGSLFVREDQPGLFAPATSREEVAAAARAKDDERNGRADTVRTDMAAGDGELFAGNRPEQAAIETTDLPAQDGATYGNTRPLLPEQERGRIASPQGAPSGRGAAPALRGQTDLFVTTRGGAQPDERSEPAVRVDRAKLGNSARLVQTGQFNSSISVVNSWHDAASIVAPLRKSPQEQMLALALDKNDRPIAVVRHTLGTVNESLVEPSSILGALAAVPGVRAVYFAHNHPSGRHEFSEEDRNITKALSGLLEGSGIAVRGMIVVTPGGKASFMHGDAFLHGSGEQPTPQRRSGAVPQVERVLRKVAGPATISLADPDVAKAYIERNTRSGDSGVVLLDIHHGLIGQLPFEPSQAVRLRTGDPSTGYASLIRQVAEANATAAIVFGPPSAGEALRNVATALAQTRVRVLDLFKVENGQAISTRKTGGRMTNDTFFQRGSALPAEDGAPQERLPFGGRSLDAVRAQVDHVTGSWKGAPAINLHESPEDLPQSLQAEAKAQGVPLNEIVAAWHDGEIHLVGSHPDLTTERQVEEAIWHEAVGHHGVRKVLGNDLRPFLIKLADDMGGVVGLLAEAKRQGIDLSDYEAATRDNPNVSRMDRVAILAEELAAHIAQKGPPALKQRLKEWLGAIKNWLRSHGFPRLSKLSDLDLANLLRRSRKAVKTGVDGKAEAGTTFSRAAVDEGEDRATEQARDTSLPVPTPPALPQSPRAPGESHAEWQTRLAATHAGALRRALHRIYNDPFNVPKTQAERDVRELGRQGFVGMLAHLDRSYGQAEAAVHDHKVRFDKMTEPERLASIDQWETGATVTDPMAAQFFAAIDSAFESRIAEIQRLKPGALTNLIQNYFPHIWVKPTKASIFYRGKAPLEGDKSFLKKRTWPTLKQGIASGLEPVTTNPAELAMMKLAQMDKFIGMLDYRNALNARGWVHRQPAGDHIPPGWAPVKDPAFTGENRFIVEGEDGQKAVVQHVNYLVPEPLANDINNYLSRGLRDVPGWRQLRFVQNLLMAGRLGWSGFHAGFTTMDNLVLHADTAARRLMMGDFENGLIDLLKAPLSIVTAPYYGGQLKQSWFGTRSSDPHTAALLDLLEKGGARAHMDPSEWNGGLAKAIAAARQHSAGGVAKNALGAVTDASGWLIHRKLVPAQKMSARVLLLKFELDRFAKKYRKLGKDEGDYAGIIDAMTPDAAAQIARKVVNLIDDRLGQMAYDNQFWNQYVRHAAQVAVGAPGWQVGTVRTVTGAVTDTAKMLSGPEKIIGPLDKAGTITDGTFGRLTGRQSYLLTLAMVSVAITSTLQYLLTGHGPDEPKDVFFPKTGRSNPDGTAERVSLPSYWKEHYALAHNPLQTAMHKIHPLFGGLWELGHNQDFYGTQIRDEDAPLGKQALQVGEYIAKAFAPYVVAGNAKLDKTDAGIGAKVGNFFGVTPAPASVSRTPFQEYLAKRGAAHASQGGRTQEQADRSNARNEAIDATRAGKNPDLSQFTEPDRKRIAADSQLVQPQVRFQRLSLGEKLHAWNMATPQERDDYDLSSLILKSDWQKYIDAQPETDRQDLLDQLQAVKDTPVANYSDRLLRSEDGSLEAPRETPSGPSPATVYAQHAQAQKLRDAEVAVRDAFTQRGEDAAYAELERHRDVLGGDVIIEVTYSGGKDHLAIHGLKERKQELLDRIK